MKGGGRLLFVVLALFLVGVLFVVIQMERGLSDRRHFLSQSSIVWTCERLPATGVLARVLAGRVLTRHKDHGRSLWWHPTYAIYTLYYRLRVPESDLIENYLKTPSNREKNCKRI